MGAVLPFARGLPGPMPAHEPEPEPEPHPMADAMPAHEPKRDLSDAQVIWEELLCPLGRPWTRESAAAQPERLRERELQIAAHVGRRWAWPEEYVWSRRDKRFYDVIHMEGCSAKGVDGSIPLAHRRHINVRPSTEIRTCDNYQWVEAAVWAPGEPLIIQDWAISDHRLSYPMEAPGARLLNLYRAPPARPPMRPGRGWRTVPCVPCIVRMASGALRLMTRKELTTLREAQ